MNSKKGNIKITFSSVEMTLHFPDGRKVSAPLAWYPRLLHGTKKQRDNWELIGNNRGFSWPDLDEDLSIEGILHGIPSPEYKKSAKTKNHQPESRI